MTIAQAKPSDEECEPEISVIIASYNSKTLIGACLRSLESQVTSRPFEVIVIDSSSDDSADFVSTAFPKVKLRQCKERKFAGDARNIGIAEARGRIVAFIDTDCRAERDWIERIGGYHQSPDLAIGGAIANYEPANLIAWASYFCEFSQWMPGLPPRWLGDMAGANISYKKDIFDKYGGFIPGTYCSDTEFHWRMAGDGIQVRWVPMIRVSHKSLDNLGRFLKHEYFHGRSFARVRVQARKLSNARRLLYVFLWPLIALLLFCKIASLNIRYRLYWNHFLRSAALLLLGLICWSAGEGSGYVKGADAR